MPTMGSLFAGIGGFDLGFTRAGFDVAWQVEIDPWCRKVLAKNFPKAERYADIRECGAHNLSAVDVVCGGFPCQDISNAGLRAGIEGERSGLWSQMWRIIGELRPQFVLVENVAALLGRGMGRVLGDLAEIGYDAEWEVVSAADIGAPHLRERVWIVAYSDSQLRGRNNLRDYAQRCKFRDEPLCESEGLGAKVSNSVRLRKLQPQGRVSDEWERTRYGDWWSSEPALDRVAYGIPDGVDRLRGLGNAVVPQIPELYARKIREVLDTE